MGDTKTSRNAQFLSAARRIRRRPANFTDAIGRAQRNAARRGTSARVSQAADNLRDRPDGFTSAINRVRGNVERNRRRLR